MVLYVTAGYEEVAATPAAALVDTVLPEDRVAEAVYDARIAELADSAAVTGQIVVSTVIVSVTT